MYKSKILKIDSSKATQYYNAQQTSFLFQLEAPISVTNSETIVYSLTNAYIPYSFYSVNINNCMLDIQETYTGVLQSSTTIRRFIKLPYGNYNANDFMRMLLSLLNVTNNIHYTIIYNKISNTYSISSSLNTDSVFLFQSGLHALQSCHTFLGFPQLDTIINSTPFQTGCITMNDIYYFQIKSDIGSGINFMMSDNSDGILDVVPIADQPMSFITYNPINPSKFLLLNNSLNSIKIGLTDNHNRIVDLNGIPFLLTIKIDIIDSVENGMHVGNGRDDMVQDHEKTNLEYFMEKPALVQPAATINIQDLVEYNLIQKMLKKVKKNKK